MNMISSIYVVFKIEACYSVYSRNKYVFSIPPTEAVGFPLASWESALVDGDCFGVPFFGSFGALYFNALLESMSLESPNKLPNRDILSSHRGKEVEWPEDGAGSLPSWIVLYRLLCFVVADIPFLRGIYPPARLHHVHIKHSHVSEHIFSSRHY